MIIKVDEAIAVSLPFGMSCVIQMLNLSVKEYTKRALRLTLPPERRVSAYVEQQFIDLAVYTYRHLSFIFSILMATISCMGYTILSKRPILAVVGAAGLVFIIPFYLVCFQGLTSDDLEGRKGRPMKVCIWISIGILWVVTLYAKIN